jgi:hypothetical protein
MSFSIVTPSFGQLDWLELCIASVRDQVANLATQGAGSGEQGVNRGNEWRVTSDDTKKREASPLTIEHIVCDGGSAGIAEFKEHMLARFPETPDYRLEFVIGPDAGGRGIVCSARAIRAQGHRTDGRTPASGQTLNTAARARGCRGSLFASLWKA